jgi:t-SNARE complex subunit (syntaxin)
LKEIALDMGQELDKQNEVLDRVDVKVENALDHVDNINIQLKKALDGVIMVDVGYEGRQVYG